MLVSDTVSPERDAYSLVGKCRRSSRSAGDAFLRWPSRRSRAPTKDPAVVVGRSDLPKPVEPAVLTAGSPGDGKGTQTSSSQLAVCSSQ